MVLGRLPVAWLNCGMSRGDRAHLNVRKVTNYFWMAKIGGVSEGNWSACGLTDEFFTKYQKSVLVTLDSFK